jgi:hypothetical protein
VHIPNRLRAKFWPLLLQGQLCLYMKSTCHDVDARTELCLVITRLSSPAVPE